MSDDNEALEVEQPKTSPTATGVEWVNKTNTPKWQHAAACMVARLAGQDFDTTVMTEPEFAAALERVA